MAEMVAYLKSYNTIDNPALAEINMKEIRRYAGMGKATEVIQAEKMLGTSTEGAVTLGERSSEEAIIDECLKEVLPVLNYKVSYARCSLEWNGLEPVLPFNIYGSQDIVTNLKNCDEIVLFAATIGIGIDRIIAKYNRISPVKALFLQAIGAERIEALCNLFNTEIRDEALALGKYTHPRYSPGYGDLPLMVQKDFMVLLDCSRRLGVNLNESLLMSPSKSVTAIIGIENTASRGGIGCDKYIADQKIEHTCSSCTKLDCQWRA